MSFISGHVLLANLTPRFGFLECSELDSGCVPWGSSGPQVPAVWSWRPWHLLAAAHLLPSHRVTVVTRPPARQGPVSLHPWPLRPLTGGSPHQAPPLLRKAVGEGEGSQVTHAW